MLSLVCWSAALLVEELPRREQEAAAASSGLGCRA